MKKKILCTIGEFSPQAKKILEEVGTVDCKTLTQKELADCIAPYDWLVVQLGLKADRAVMDAAPNLKVIASTTTGLDHIDTKYAEKKGISVVSLKGETDFLNSVTSTAELAFGLLLGLARSLPPAAQAVLNGEWQNTAWRGDAFQGKTLGIIGLGRLGKMMARFGEAFGMKVIYTDPVEKTDVYERMDLDTLLHRSDVVSLHVPLDEKTGKLIGEDALAKMKETALLINTSRGEIVDEQALLRALEARKIAGYATDVLTGENDFGGDCSGHPLVRYAQKHRNILITPHIGGMTREARTATDIFIATRLRQATGEGTRPA